MSDLPQFCGLDGEGSNRPDGSQAYVLLCASDGEHDEWTEDTGGAGLSTSACLAFLTRKRPGRTLVSFYFGYDVTKILYQIGPKHLTTLWDEGWVVWRDTRVSYLIEYIPKKMLKIGIVCGQAKRKRGARPPTYRGSTSIIYDTSGFFNGSFVAALDMWDIGSKDERDAIAAMKGRRNEFEDEKIGEMRAYCLSECRLLVRLMDKVALTLSDANISVRSWLGAGSIASALMKREKVVRGYPPVRYDVLPALLGAYSGGRTELVREGVTPGALYVYDINSAYAAALVIVPDFSGAWWERSRRDEYEDSDRYRYGVYDIEWDCRDTAEALPFGPFPYRRAGRMYYPFRGRTWVHHVEYAQAVRTFGREHFRVHGGWVLRGVDDRTPFGYLGDLCRQRLAYKRVGDPRHIVLKLGVNSHYGKLAQKQTAEGYAPPYRSYYLAGYTTAACRAQLLGAMADAGDSLSMVATDAVFTTRRLHAGPGLLLGSGLGEWEEKGPYHDALLVQSGVVFTPDKAIVRTRGFGADTLSYARVRKMWDRLGPAGGITYRERRFIGIGACAGHGSYRDYGRWVTQKRQLSFSLFPTKVPAHGYLDREEQILLHPNDAYLAWDGVTKGEPYELPRLATGEAARLLAEIELATAEFSDQP